MTFYPEAEVPEGTRTSRLLLRPLRATDAELDYDAVMSDPAALRRWSQSDWPSDVFTVAENRADLERHEREHVERAAFTYTVLSPDATRCLGCVYLTPVRPEAADQCSGATHPVQAAFWVRASEIDAELDRHLLSTLIEWLKTSWAFDCVLFTISRQDERQAALLQEADFERKASVTLSDGRSCGVFLEA